MNKIYILFLVMVFLYPVAEAQQNVHQQSTVYEYPKDSLVKAKLEKWQDQKFGMIIHWGVYAVPGIIESWSICSEDWIERDSTMSYDDYKKWYFGLSREFNPVKFEPKAWAKAGKAAGMKYLIFTTKHHDGFAMFDTKVSDYSIAKGPFANNEKKDVARHVFDAFREQGFMIGAYFSKPDWHSEYYWWPKYATPDRNNNYDLRKHPWRWNKFKEYTHAQIGELMHNYGKVDILWLDGGWVRPLESVNDEVRSWGANIPAWSQDIGMPGIADMARKAQPGILMVDRTVHGPYENYQTPEQKVPEHQLDHPWESCMTLGGAWGFVPNDEYKSASTVIHTLIEVVAKGGSLLLGVGPKPDGTFPELVTSRLEEIGKWVAVNGKALYETRITKNYRDADTWFTQSKDGKTKYALSCLKAGAPLPEYISFSGNRPKKSSRITLLQTGEKLKWESIGNLTKVYLPGNLPEGLPALAFAFLSE